MKKIGLIIFFIFCIVITTNAQSTLVLNKYYKTIEEAKSLYKNQKYLKSAQKYEEAFLLLGKKGQLKDIYNVACAWALAGNKDKAFKRLNDLTNKDIVNYYTFITNPDFISLHNDKRWRSLDSIFKLNRNKKIKNPNITLLNILDTIFPEDQKYRLQLNKVEKEYGVKSKQYKSLWAIINAKDYINVLKAKKIINEYGWPSIDMVGEEGITTMFLVLQHAPINKQLYYLPMMKKALKEGNLLPSDYALFEDRVLLAIGKKQIYGSQIASPYSSSAYYIRPIEDPDNVDKRRLAVGLDSLHKYVSNWGLKWNVEEHKKKYADKKNEQTFKQSWILICYL